MNPHERFDLIMSRQGRFEWGEKYMPSTMAVPREAPKGSRISRLHSRKLNRTLHVLSGSERLFAQLALYHPNLFELHEQKMLWPVKAGHPLRGHPLTKGTFPPPLGGTVEIATEIGFKHYDVGDDAELIQLPRCRRPSLIPRELLPVLGFYRLGGGSALRRHEGQLGIGHNKLIPHSVNQCATKHFAWR